MSPEGGSNEADNSRSSFYESIKIFLSIFKYLGMIPLKSYSSEFQYLVFDWKSKECVISYVLNLIVYPANVFVYYYYIKYESHHEPVYRIRMKVLVMFELISQGLLIIIVFWAYLNMRFIFEKMYKVDKFFLQKFPHKDVNFGKEKYVKYGTTIFGLLIIFLYIIKNCAIIIFSKETLSKIPIMIYIACHVYGYIWPLIIHSTYCIVTTLAIRYRLQIIDDLILDYTDKLGCEIPNDRPSEFINKIKFTYYHLSECKNAFNNAYGPFQRSIYVNTMLILTIRIFISTVLTNPVSKYVILTSAFVQGFLFLAITSSAEALTAKVVL